MATPDFVLALREKIGNAPLWLSGITAVVTRPVDASPDHSLEVLLVKRSDNGAWTPVTGIIDPGEEPAVAAEREVLEEAHIVAVAESLAWVHVIQRVIRYANGDETRYLDLVFRCRYVSGEPFPADGENTEAARFRVDALPEMTAEMDERIRSALGHDGPAKFER